MDIKSTPMIKRLTLSLLTLALICIALPGFGRDVQLLDRIVAVVNDDVVLASELRDQMRKMAGRLRAADSALPPLEVLMRRAVEQLILEKLQLAEAERLGIDVDQETLNRALTNIADNNGMSLAELRQAVERDGMEFDRFRDSIRDQILITRLRNREVVSRIQVSKVEVDAQLERLGKNPGGRSAFHLRHILVATPEGASSREIQAAQAKARKLLAQLEQGADFRRLAQAESDGRQALEGGDLGWLQAEQLPQLFADEAAGLQRGELAGPLRSSSGFHIIKLEDYRGGDRNIVAQTHARHILIRTDELTSDEDARQRLQRLRERIVGGDDFATLARANSDDKGSAINGGDLKWVNPGDLVPKFEEVMNSLPPGEISRPFETEFGWHIVQVLDRRDYDATDEAARARAREIIRDRKADEALELYLRRLRDEAFVELRLEDDLG